MDAVNPEGNVLGKIPMLQALLESYRQERLRLQARIDILEAQARELRQQLRAVKDRASHRRAF